MLYALWSNTDFEFFVVTTNAKLGKGREYAKDRPA
jgi:hypothetical protein